MADKAAERRRKRRERVLEIYKRDYLRPYMMAIRDNADVHERVRLSRKLSDFRLGVVTADTDGKWVKRFNAAWDELAKEFGWDG